MTPVAVLLSLFASALAAEDSVVVSPATQTDGILINDVRSAFQKGTTQIKVLLPDQRQPDQKFPVIYVLPVEANNESRYGDGLAEIKKHNLHNTHNAVFVAPTFSHLPWYCDHPTDPAIRQETYFLNVVLPFIEKTYPVQADRDHRFLLGFSKSGYGAWTLLIRHPHIFAKAAAWDAPLMMPSLGKYGTTPIFGTEENFTQYRLTDLLKSQPNTFQGPARLFVTGYGGFRPDHEQMHALLSDLKISHIYRDGPSRKHDWHSGWVPEAVELLVSSRPSEKTSP